MPADSPDDSLASEIRASLDSGKLVKTQLETNERIIARVTDGIYREPWAAFRELVANAYDADATVVTIETGAPEFAEIVVRDNGLGMTPEALAYVIHNIGGSSKRTSTGVRLNTVRKSDPERSPGGRPLIGKIGIGLFAVAQLTQHFQIITKAKGEAVRTSATVTLRTHDEEQLKDGPGSKRKYVAGSVTIKSERVPKAELGAHGTSIVLHELRPEIRRALQSIRRWQAVETVKVDGKSALAAPKYHIGLAAGALSKKSTAIVSALPWVPSDSPEMKFSKLIAAAADAAGRTTKAASLEHFDDYLRLIWQLSLSLPFVYVDRHPFDLTGKDGLIVLNVPGGNAQSQAVKIASSETLRKHFGLSAGGTSGRFDVTLDGVLLRRPINLETTLERESRIAHPVIMIAKEKAPFKDEDLERAGGPLSFEAYLYWNSKIVPKDNAGVLVRIREASGTLFDPMFLRYQVSEQNRLRQITAEIFVTEGLDGAINIDRESFNYSHPHFLYIQRWLHKALRLLANRLKAMADENLTAEKAQKASEGKSKVTAAALNVWRDRLGKNTDPPVPRRKFSDDAPAEEVGGVEIDWTESPLAGNPTRATALAIVLEAYGILSGLTPEDRAKLINDIIKVFDTNL